MRILINNSDVPVEWVEVSLSIGKLARQFTLAETAAQPSYKIGDTLEAYDMADDLLVRAEIEFLSIDERQSITYAGRNAAKNIVDAYAARTVQFSEAQTLETLLEEIAGEYGISVTGSASMPKGSASTILIGDPIGGAVLNIASASGKIVMSDAVGNLAIEGSPAQGEVKFVYGENMRKRQPLYDNTLIYDKYTVVSQSDYVLSGESEVNTQGSYGSGKRCKVLVSGESLTEQECENLARFEYTKDRRAAFQYGVEIDSWIPVKLNTLYAVSDASIGLDERLNVKEIVHTFGSDVSGTYVVFERVPDA